MSEVFLDVWRQAVAFKARSSVSTWLFAIARYKALSARRRRIDVKLEQDVAAGIVDPADDPERALEKKRRDELLRHCLGMLTPEHGEVIDLVYYHGRSVKDVADIIGIPEATVKLRMFHARKKLAELTVSQDLCRNSSPLLPPPLMLRADKPGFHLDGAGSASPVRPPRRSPALKPPMAALSSSATIYFCAILAAGFEALPSAA